MGARSAITALTLWGGLASTVCWPLSAFLVEQLGWRGACWVYAGLQLGLALPAYLLLLPREDTLPAMIPRGLATGPTPASDPPKPAPLVLPLLAATIMVASVLSSAMSVHLLTVLQFQGVALGTAVALGALVGPAQVAARLIEMFIARFHHPIWTKSASTLLVAAGITLLWIGAPPLALALVLYGAGIGLESIARGTLPLALFGAQGYATLMGRIAMGSLIAQAASPSLAALVIDQADTSVMLATMIVIGLANTAGVLLLWFLIVRR